MNLLQKAIRLKTLRLKAKHQSHASRHGKPPSAIIKSASSKRGTNLISPTLLISVVIGSVIGIGTIAFLLQPAKRTPSTALSVPSTANPPNSSQHSLAADNHDKPLESRQQIAALVSDWANAWAAKDADKYLAFYAPEFAPPNGLTLPAWERLRRSRLGKYRRIEIALSGLTVSLEQNTATAEFVQSFKADGFSETGLHKRLELKLHGARWLIVKETSGKG